MTDDLKEQVKSTGRTLGVIGLGAALVGGVTYFVLPPAPPAPTATWYFKSNPGDPPGTFLQILSTTNLSSGQWQVETNLPGAATSYTFPRNLPQKFFRLRSGVVYADGAKAVTNWSDIYLPK